jgi:lysyl-tRNA synthetase class I
MDIVVPAELNRYTPGWITDAYDETVPTITLDSRQTNSLLAFLQHLPPKETLSKMIQKHVKRIASTKDQREGSFLIYKGVDEARNVNDYIRLATQLVINSVSTTDAYNQQVYNKLIEKAKKITGEIDQILEKQQTNPFDTEATLQAQHYRSAAEVAEGVAQIAKKVEQQKAALEDEKGYELGSAIGMGVVKCTPILVSILAILLRFRR